MIRYPRAMGPGASFAACAAAALAEPGEKEAAMLVTGERSISFHCAELHSRAHVRLILNGVVGNDAAWGTKVHRQVQARAARSLFSDLRDGRTAFGALGD
jgi:hypothetical protein